MKTITRLLAPVCILAAPVSALAAEPPDAAALPAPPAHHLGEPGQLVLFGQSTADLSGVSVHQDGQSAHRFRAGLDLTAARFISPHLALGGSVGGKMSAGGGANPLNTLKAGPALLVHAPLSEHVSFLPKISLLYAFASERVTVPAKTSLHTHGIEGEIDLAIASQLGGNLGLSVGPFVNVAWQDLPLDAPSATIFTYGLKVGLLGWL